MLAYDIIMCSSKKKKGEYLTADIQYKQSGSSFEIVNARKQIFSIKAGSLIIMHTILRGLIEAWHWIFDIILHQ